MVDEKIVILMSTFNGEAYLPEQLDSIIKQSNKNWVLYVRDDGSKDLTVNIIDEYIKKDSRIKKFNDKVIKKNLGPMRSFFVMLKEIDADYYMFSDQDDVWLPHKVQQSLNAIKKAELLVPKKPCLVHTNLKLVDSQLAPLSSQGRTVANDDLKSLLIANDITGCTVMINDYLKQLSLNSMDIVDVMHDMWLGLLAVQFGLITYISTPTMLYRQHNGNVVGTSSGIIDRINRINSKSEYQRIVTSVNAARILKKLYSNQFDSQEKNIVETIASIGKISFLHLLGIMIKNKIFKNDFPSTIAFFMKIRLNYSRLRQIN